MDEARNGIQSGPSQNPGTYLEESPDPLLLENGGEAVSHSLISGENGYNLLPCAKKWQFFVRLGLLRKLDEEWSETYRYCWPVIEVCIAKVCFNHITPEWQFIVRVCHSLHFNQGEGTQPPSLLSLPGAGSVRLCNAMETKLPHSPSFPHSAS